MIENELKKDIKKLIENEININEKLYYNLSIKKEIKLFNEILKKYENELKKYKKEKYFIMNYKKINYKKISLFNKYLIYDLFYLKNIKFN